MTRFELDFLKNKGISTQHTKTGPTKVGGACYGSTHSEIKCHYDIVLVSTISWVSYLVHGAPSPSSLRDARTKDLLGAGCCSWIGGLDWEVFLKY